MKRFDDGDEFECDDDVEEQGAGAEESDDSSDPFEEGSDFGNDSGLDCSGFLGSDMGDDIPQIMLTNGKKVYCHEELLHEFENYKKFFGDKAIFACPNDPEDDSIFIYMDFDLSSAISSQTAMSWGIDKSKRYFIGLHIMAGDFRKEHLVQPRSVDVLMGEPGEPKTTEFTAHFQLSSICRNFVENTWESSTEMFESPMSETTKREDRMYVRFCRCRSGESEELEDVSDKDECFAQLVSMGFKPELCYAAMKLSDWNLQTAITLVTECPEDLTRVTVEKSELKAMTKKSEALLKKRKKGKESKLSTSSHSLSASLSSSSGTLKLDTNTYFIETALYLRSRLSTLNDYCIICDQKHLMGSMLKPTVCARDLCVWSFQELGVASDATDFVANSQEVVDLLLFLAKEACASSRRDIIFDPFPTIFDPADPTHQRKILDAEHKDFSRAQAEMAKIPLVSDIIKRNPSNPDVRGAWVSAGPYCAPLANWVISSNRCFFVKLTPDIAIKEINGEQFLMLSAPPETENAFRSLRKQHGSVFAFHGSSIENWHSIIRNGLKNASGTKFQVNGTAYGSGIYMSPNLSYAMGYSSSVGCCVAVLEVINTSAIKRHNADIWTLRDEKHVVTRMLLRLPGNSSRCYITGEQIAPKVRDALRHYKMPVD